MLLIALLTSCGAASAADHARALPPPAPPLVKPPAAVPPADAATLADEAANFRHARSVADDILHRPEFQREMALTWWQGKKLAMTRAIARLFARFSRIGAAVPWLARALECTLFGGAAVGLLLFVLRELRRQRLQVSLAGTSIQSEAWSREADDWSHRAEAFARERQWRDAVHCVYWAAIVLLEARRAWRHNPTRTPREYLRLLRADSPQHVALRGLTHVFERTWYGLRETTATEYAEARALYDRLAANGANTGGNTGAPTRIDATPAAAEGL